MATTLAATDLWWTKEEAVATTTFKIATVNPTLLSNILQMTPWTWRKGAYSPMRLELALRIQLSALSSSRSPMCSGMVTRTSNLLGEVKLANSPKISSITCAKTPTCLLLFLSRLRILQLSISLEKLLMNCMWWSERKPAHILTLEKYKTHKLSTIKWDQPTCTPNLQQTLIVNPDNVSIFISFAILMIPTF